MADSAEVVHVEVKQLRQSALSSVIVEKEVTDYLFKKEEVLCDVTYSGEVLPQHVEFFRVSCSSSGDQLKLKEGNVVLRFYIYQNFLQDPQPCVFDGDVEDLPASTSWPLPNEEFEGLWETLFLENNLKNQLMNYVQAALLYSKKKVSSKIVRWNGVVLLHGPPGTGKTSLSRALAHKLSVRLNSEYKSGQLVEINAHCLFSKWFSESPKLVLKFFSEIKNILEFKENFVCVLLDEVESLTYARKTSDSDPVDANRVVNAVLTQLDQLQRYPNVLILATSNITNAIDIAFADRADLKLFLGYPGKWEAYKILRSCILELLDCNLITGSADEIFEAKTLIKMQKGYESYKSGIMPLSSSKLLEISKCCGGLSGRTLRKLPFLTSAFLIDKPLPDIARFLAGMKKVTADVKAGNKKFFYGNTDNPEKLFLK